MTFDRRAFLKTEFFPREETLSIPALKWCFRGDEPLWTVRGLNLNEVTRARNAVDKNNLAISVAEILADKDTDVVDALKQELGLSDTVPAEIAQHLEYLVMGSVNPVISLPVAVKLSEVNLVEFKLLVNKIVELTGLGMVQKKN